MSKSIKLKNDTYIDGSAIRINRKTILDYIYPIGSIYMSVNSTSPETLFGGVWQKIEDRFLIGASYYYPLGETGGEANHRLTIEEMPSHTHTQESCTNPGNHNHSISTWYKGQSASAQTLEGWGTRKHEKYHYTGNAGSHTHTITLNNTGGGRAHNNMPPYIAVNIWKRTE